ESWRAALRALVANRGATVSMLEIAVDRQPARVAAFAVQVAATEARTTHDAIRIAIGGPAMDDRTRREELYRAELPPYVDTIVTSAAASEISDWLHRVDPAATIALTTAQDSSRRGPGAPTPTRRIVDGILEDLGTDVALHAWPAAAV